MIYCQAYSSILADIKEKPLDTSLSSLMPRTRPASNMSTCGSAEAADLGHAEDLAHDEAGHDKLVALPQLRVHLCPAVSQPVPLVPHLLWPEASRWGLQSIDICPAKGRCCRGNINPEHATITDECSRKIGHVSYMATCSDNLTSDMLAMLEQVQGKDVPTPERDLADEHEDPLEFQTMSWRNEWWVSARFQSNMKYHANITVFWLRNELTK